MRMCFIQENVNTSLGSINIFGSSSIQLIFDVDQVIHSFVEKSIDIKIFIMLLCLFLKNMEY